MSHRNPVTKKLGNDIANAIRSAHAIKGMTGGKKDEKEPATTNARVEYWRSKAMAEASKVEELERQLARAKRVRWHLVSLDDIIEELARRQKEAQRGMEVNKGTR